MRWYELTSWVSTNRVKEMAATDKQCTLSKEIKAIITFISGVLIIMPSVDLSLLPAGWAPIIAFVGVIGMSIQRWAKTG